MAKIIIIGGGVAGLSAGIYAQLSGHHAVICEKNQVLGGNLTGWQRGEYHIDNCIHWLTGTNPASASYKMWVELGALGDVDVYQGDTLYTYEQGGKAISLYKDINRLEGEMLKYSHDDKEEIQSFIKAIKIIQGISSIGGVNHNEKSTNFQKLLSLPVIMKYHRMSTRELANRFKSPLIQGFLSTFIGESFSSLALIAVFAHFCGENGGIPRGGSVSMAKRMERRFTDLGGTVLPASEVMHIETRGSLATCITLADGTQEHGDYFVLTTDPQITFGTIIGCAMPKALTRLYKNSRLFRFSSYHCAFSCDTDTLPFKGDYIFEIPEEFHKKLHTSHLTLREFSHEKSFAPRGKSIIQTMVFLNGALAKEFIKLRCNPQKYQAKKQELSSITEDLIVNHFPELKGKLKCIDVWTPASYKRYVNSEIGSYMSFVIAPGYLPTSKHYQLNAFKNVFLATQWQQPPGGLPIAAEAGKMAIEAICKLEKQYERKRQKSKVSITS